MIDTANTALKVYRLPARQDLIMGVSKGLLGDLEAALEAEHGGRPRAPHAAAPPAHEARQ